MEKNKREKKILLQNKLGIRPASLGGSESNKREETGV